jgi:cytoskeletal protein RodZ
VALSMDEQRILDEMERKLAADDPRLAARLGSFGQRMPSHMRFQHARTIGGVLALALIAAVTVMVFVVSPFANHVRNEHRPTTPPSAAANTPRTTSSSKSSGPADQHASKSAAAAKTTPTSSKSSRH